MQLGSPPFYRAWLVARRTLTLLIASVALIGMTACGDDDGPTGSGGGIEGTWVSDDFGFTQYLRVTSTTFTSYVDFDEGCVYREVSQIVDRNGDVITFEDEDGMEFTAEVRRSGSNLVVEGEVEGQPIVLTFQPSNVNVANLEICTDGGPIDPGGTTCTSLPAATVGGTVNGTLTTTDGEGGSYYDLYRLQLASSRTVQITMRSNDVDSYLVLLDSDYGSITEDDDTGGGSTGYDAQITTSLSSGCYVIVVTSWGEDETGAYSLTVN